MKRLICWWFGCDTDPESAVYDAYNENGDYRYFVPCRRCGAFDTSYADQVGDTRHRRFVDGLKSWLWYRWRRPKTTIDNNEDIPF